MPLFLRGLPLVLFLFRMWRKLPAAQKRQALQILGRYGPVLIAVGAKQAREARQRARARAGF